MSDHPVGEARQLLASQLSPGAQLFVFSARNWLVAAKSKHCVRGYLAPFYERLGAGDALPVMDELMCNLAVAAFRPIQVHCPCRVDLSEDESLLLDTLRAVQRSDHERANQLAQEFLSGAMATTFIRVADAYVEQLRESNLSVTGMRYLCAVDTATQAQHITH
ncbi:MAG: hypothetical protein AAF513_02125 [Pseudomonadota bacterium]